MHEVLKEILRKWTVMKLVEVEGGGGNFSEKKCWHPWHLMADCHDLCDPTSDIQLFNSPTSWLQVCSRQTENPVYIKGIATYVHIVTLTGYRAVNNKMERENNK
jgi:hypothetical protein